MSNSKVMINYLELPASDLDATKAFYSDAFGWAWIDYGPTYSAFEGAGIDGGLNVEATPGQAHEAGAESAIGPLVLFAADNLEEVLNRVVAAGGQIVSDPYEYPGGRRFHFRDPSGNILGAYQPSQ